MIFLRGIGIADDQMAFEVEFDIVSAEIEETKVRLRDLLQAMVAAEMPFHEVAKITPHTQEAGRLIDQATGELNAAMTLADLAEAQCLEYEAELETDAAYAAFMAWEMGE